MPSPSGQNNLRAGAGGEGAYVDGSYSGLITGIASAGSATNGHLWAVRFATAAGDKRRAAVIQRLRARLFTATGYTAAQEVTLTLFKLTGFTALHTGGSAVTPSKKWTGYPATLMTGRIAGTGQLTAGTQTLDTDPIRTATYAELAAAPTVPKGVIDLFMSTEDLAESPLAIGNNEGLLIRSEIAQGGGGVARLAVEMDWAEVVRF
jgi:hypothetical protein